MLTTKVHIVLRKSERKGVWYILLESYPILIKGKKTRLREHIHKEIYTPKFDKSKGKRIFPMLDKEGIIVCATKRDRDICLYAERLRQQRQTEYDRLSLLTPEERAISEQTRENDCNFIDYFKSLNKKLHVTSSESIKVNWTRGIELLSNFMEQKPLLAQDLSEELINEYKVFLLTCPCKDRKGILSQNSASTYFRIFRCALKNFYKDNFIKIDLASRIEGISKEETLREYLSHDEVQRLINTPCEDEVLYKASIFSILTGLRHSDIKKLKWEDIHDNDQTPQLNIKQKKTKQPLYMPISPLARELCGQRKENHQYVYEDLKDISWISRPLSRWIKKVGIKKHITFHCFRHTYAILQLLAGTDILTVSKMLGHTKLETTLIYAKVVDSMKNKASEALTFILPKK